MSRVGPSRSSWAPLVSWSPEYPTRFTDFIVDYAAPEVLQGKAYGGKEQDVWALGILLYTIVYKENPFYNIDEILDHPLRVPFTPFDGEEEGCLDLIKRMLDREVDERIGIDGVRNHLWLKSDDEA